MYVAVKGGERAIDNAHAWLAEERRKAGEALEAGAIVSTGSMTGMLPVKGPCKTRVQFGDIAAVQIDFI